MVGALSLGCAHVELPPERLTPELRDEAASWQALDDTSGPVSDEALERRIELALEIGELQAAWEAATTRVARARVEVARATARDDARAVRKARRPWARASHRAFEVAQRSKRAPWIIQAALDAPKPDRYRKAVLDALEHDAWVLAPNDRRRLLEVFDHPKDRARILSHAHDLTKRQWLEVFEELPPSTHDLALLQGALWRSLDLQADADTLSEIADAILEEDPWNLPAHVLSRTLAAVERGEIKVDPTLFEDAGAPYFATASSIVRLERRLERRDHRALRLALVFHLWNGGLSGDAHDVLQGLAGSPEDRLSELLRALVELDRGNPKPFRTWRERHDDPSAWLDQEIARYDVDAFAPELRAVGSEARRSLFDRGRSATPWTSLALRTRLDDEASAGQRRRALRNLRAETARRVALCRREGLDADACNELSSYGWESNTASDPTSRSIVLAAGEREPWHFFDSLREFEQARSVPAAARPSFVQTRIETALEHEEFEQARRLLARDADRLPAPDLLRLTLLEADLRDTTPEFLPHQVLPDLAGFAEGTQHDPELPGRYGEIQRAHLAMGRGEPAEALERLTPWAENLHGRAGGLVAAYAAWAALEAGDDAAVQHFFTAVQQRIPDSAAEHLLQAELLRRDGAWKPALEHYLETLARAPSSRRAVAGVFELALEHDEVSFDFLREVAGAHDGMHPSLVLEALPHVATRDELLAVYRVDQGELPEQPEQLATLGTQIGTRLAELMLARMQTSKDRAKARALAPRVLEILERLPATDWVHDQRIGLLFLLNRVDEAHRLATAPPTHLDHLRLPEAAVKPSLISALEAGALDEQQVYDLWLWIWTPEPDVPESVARMVEQPWAPQLYPFACQSLIQDDFFQEAIAICRKAHEHRPSAVLGTNLSHAALSSDEDESSTLQWLFAQDEPPTFVEDPSRPDTLTSRALWYGNQAVWKARQGDLKGSSAARVEALALGAEPDDDWNESEAPFRGRSIRYAGADAWSTGPYAALRSTDVALFEGRLDLASFYAEVAHSRTHDEDDLSRFSVGLRQAFIELAALDEEASNLTDEGVQEAARLVFGEQTEAQDEAFERFVGEHDRSFLARVLWAERLTDTRRHQQARAVLDPVLERVPRQPYVALTAARIAVATEREDEARAIHRAALEAHPGHLALVAGPLPESVRGRDARVPGWLRSASDFERRLAQVELSTQDRVRVVDIEDAYEFFSTRAAPLDLETDTTRLPTGVELTIDSGARADRCEAFECARAVVQELRSEGATLQWHTARDRSGEDTTLLLATTTVQAHAILLLPRGGRIFRIDATSSLEDAAGLVEATKLVEDGFAPLDAVIPAYRAEVLRKAAAPLDDALRLVVRRDLARATTSGCPIEDVLSGLNGDDDEASALVDAWLATPRAETRRALVRCAPPTEPAAARIGVLALIEDDAALHRYGEAVVAAHPETALAAGRSLFTSKLDPPLASPEHFSRRDLPPRGMLELALALRDEDVQRLLGSLLQHPEPRENLLGWALAWLHPGSVTPAELRKVVADSSPDNAHIALNLFDELDPADVEVVRARFDQLDPAEPDERRLLLRMATALSWEGERADASRFAQARRKLERARSGTEDLEPDLEQLQALIRVHELVRRDDPDLDDEDGRVRAMVEAWRRAHSSDSNQDDDEKTRAPIAKTRLAGAAFPELLVGRDWVYAKVANPRLVATTTKALLSKLSADGPVEREIVKNLVEAVWESSGAHLFDEDSGLDLGRSIECGKNPTISEEGLVCMAHVTDANAVLTALTARDYGEDSGPTLAHDLASSLAHLPLLLSGAPFFVHPLIESDVSTAPDPVVLSERVRDRLTWGEHELERHMIVQGRKGDLSIDFEHYLVVEDRVFVFTDEAIARHVLFGAGATLADDPEFRRLTTEWRGTSGIAAVGLGEAAPETDLPGGVEVAVDGEGVRFRFIGHTDEPPGDSRRVRSLLPEGAAAQIAVAELTKPPLGLETDAQESYDHGRTPPSALMQAEGALAFAWYPRDNASLWDGWLGVLQFTNEDREALDAEGLFPEKSGIIVARGRRFIARRDDLVVLGSRRELVQQALERTPLAPDDERDEALWGRLDGEQAASAVGTLEPVGAMSEGYQRFVATVLGLVERSDYGAVYDPKSKVMNVSGRIELSLSDEIRSDNVVDAWLASKDHGNTLLLPRALATAELAGPLRYVFEVRDPEAFRRRVIGRSDRLRVEVLSDARVAVSVAPTSTGDAVALSARERRSLVAPTREYPAHAQNVRKILASVVGDERDPRAVARKINRWVHDRITYEVTPRRLSGAEILSVGRGDCSEYATLAVTLLRASGIPAEMRSGMAASGSDMVAHAWVAYHDGQAWREMDPTGGLDEVTAGHIEMSVLDTLALESVGAIRVVEIEAAALAKQR